MSALELPSIVVAVGEPSNVEFQMLNNVHLKRCLKLRFHFSLVGVDWNVLFDDVEHGARATSKSLGIRHSYNKTHEH